MIQLKSLYVRGTDISRGNKNFIDTEIDFTDSPKYCTLIGLNSSGKSNLLEVISKIFAGLYKFKNTAFKPDFGYIIKYKINYFEIEIELRKNPSEFTPYFKVDGESKTKAEFEENIINYIPSKLITNYSGEETRLWEEIYHDFYDDYSLNIRQNTIIQNTMNYINKYNWDMALISLLCLNDEYIKELLDISDLRYVNVKFGFDPNRYSNYGSNPVIGFLDEINPNRNFSETIDIITLQSNTVLSTEINLKKRYINLFNFLYVAYMPKDKKIITDIEVQFNDITTKQLSEGQKKLILVRFITHLLADENSFLLFDEPDSHIHVSRKEKLAELINESPGYSLLTTHSPALINFLDEKSVQLLKPHDIKGVEAIKIDKLKSIEEITENSMSIMDTSLIVSTKKHILMCEGVNDIKYIKKAINVLSRTKDSKYLKLNNIVMINCGGADNVQPVFEEIVKNNLMPSQKCTIIFDDDGTGRSNRDNIQKIITENTLTNVQTFTHPKIPGWEPNDFYMEDYFSVDAYKNDVIAKFSSGHNLQTLNQNIDVKKLINKNYNNSEKFLDQHFDNFSVLIESLLVSFDLMENDIL
jgi:hypothetical protein